MKAAAELKDTGPTFVTAQQQMWEAWRSTVETSTSLPAMMPWTLMVDTMRDMACLSLSIPVMWARIWASGLTSATIGIPETTQQANLVSTMVQTWAEIPRLFTEYWCAVMRDMPFAIARSGSPANPPKGTGI